MVGATMTGATMTGTAARIGNAAPGPAPHRGRNGGNGPPQEDERG
jgi:hypothetical protein